MQQTKIDVNGDQIAVRISDGDGPAILAIHGNSASSKAFQHQLEGDFGNTYRVIAFDLPGHGDSAPASDPETYSLPGYVTIARAVAEHFAALNGVFLGWSLGGHAVLEGVPMLKEAAGFAIFGTPPLGVPPAMDAAFKPHPTNGVLYNAELTDDQIQGFASSFFKEGYVIPNQFIEDVRNTHGEARSNFGRSVGEGRFRDEQEVVHNMERPLLIMHGVDEQLINGDYITIQTIPTLWRGEVQMMYNAGHSPQWETPTQFNEILSAFVDEVTG